MILRSQSQKKTGFSRKLLSKLLVTLAVQAKKKA